MKNDTSNLLETLTRRILRNLLVDAAKQAAEKEGYKLQRVPGRGLSNIWNMEKDGKTEKVSIRTTQDRWIAFPRIERGTKWKTLDEVDMVIVAAVDSKESPKNIEVYIFPASEVRKRFNDAYAARDKDGQINYDNFGMWVALDEDLRGIARSVGSGIVKQYPRVAVYSIEALLSAAPIANQPPHTGIGGTIDEGTGQEVQPATIAEVMAWTRRRVAEIAGVRVDAVKLDLKLES